MAVSPTSRSFYRRSFATALMLFGSWMLSACATKPVVTPVTLRVAASADVNPDGRNRASPILVRVYALRSTAPFDSADFFSLFEKDQATLGGELVQREELLLKPGDIKAVEMKLSADVKAIAVMGAYRDLERARWRAVRPVEPGKPLNLTVVFGARQVQFQ
jgi:type VI secretion system protein VasD